MAKSLDATYDPSKKWKPIEEGIYPAHVKSLTSKEITTRAGEAIVVNMTYKELKMFREKLNLFGKWMDMNMLKIL